VTVREWYGVFLPGKASPATVRRATSNVQIALAQNDLITSLAQVGLEVQSSTPQVLTDLLRADTEEWRRLVEQSGFTPES
jgi:tripartite-type tricarboxylate transporter receptor subunit TctC